MADWLYGKAREQFASGGINWGTGTGGDDIRVLLVDATDYSDAEVNKDVHEFLSSIPSGGRVAVSGALTGKSVTLGVCDAADVTFTAVSGDPVDYVIPYKHTGSDATARPIAKIDSYNGLPITVNGGDVRLGWPDDGSKIFKL
jgi:hypothetical protein